MNNHEWTHAILELSANCASSSSCAFYLKDLCNNNSDAEFDKHKSNVNYIIPESELFALRNINPSLAKDVFSIINSSKGLFTIVKALPSESKSENLVRIYSNLANKGYLPHVINNFDFDSDGIGSELGERHSGISKSNSRSDKNSGKKWNPGFLFNSFVNYSNIRLLIDTSFLMTKGADRFCENSLIPWASYIYKGTDLSLIVSPIEVVRELETMSTIDSPSDNPKRKHNAKTGIGLLHKLQSHGILKISTIGHSSSKQAADNIFVAMIPQLLLEYDLLLITQDRKLGELCRTQYLNASSSDAYTGRLRELSIARLTNNRLVPHGLQKNNTSTTKSKRKNKIKPVPLRKIEDELLSVNSIPNSEQDLIFDEQGNSFNIVPPGIGGGEGIVYPIFNNELVVKIYHRNQLMHWRFEKLAEMINQPNPNKGVAWPIKFAMNDEGANIGFFMPKVNNAIALSDFAFGIASLTESFPNWSRKELLILARNLCNVVQFLHDRGDIIGDLNPANILVHEENNEPRVRLVDCDSWQFSGFPSPVGMEEYVHPELHGRDFSTFLRSQKHDLFSLAIVVFRLIFLGTHPYAPNRDIRLAESMRNREFLFRRNSDSNNQYLPKGIAFKIWTHLPWYVQDLFQLTFVEEKLINAEKWSNELGRYVSDISNNRLDALGNANLVKPQAVRVPIKRVEGESKEFNCKEKNCHNSVTYYGRENIERIEKNRFFRCSTCAEKYTTSNQSADARICGSCNTIFRHPIWFESIIKTNNDRIPNLCTAHGGYRSNFKCATCGKPFEERDYRKWREQITLNQPLCRTHLFELKNPVYKFTCANIDCGKEFSISGQFGEKLQNKPTEYIFCFECMKQAE